MNSDIAGLEEQRQEIDDQIEAKYRERASIEDNYRYEVTAVWDVLGLKPHSEIRLSAIPSSIAEMPRRRAEVTDAPDFELLILETISELGGSGRVSDVLDRIERKLSDAGQLTHYWQELDPVQVRWKHAVHSMRVRLVRQGKMKEKSPRGVWQLSSHGNV